jgi:hypothetical protein
MMTPTNAPVLPPSFTVAAVRPFLFLLIAICAVPAQAFDPAQAPLDHAIVLRETQVFASLEVYAEIIETVQAKQFFPILRLVEDQYGIMWAMVQLDAERVGYLTDIVAVRKSAAELEGILAEVAPEEIDGWDQQMVNSIQNEELEVGMNRTQVLIAAGLPLGQRPVGAWQELRYARQTVLLRDGLVAGITRVDRLPLDRAVVLDITAKDPELTFAGGAWQDNPVADVTYRRDGSGSGSALYRFNAAVAGRYRISASWIVHDGNSPDVSYRISHRRSEIAEFRANHRLHNARFVELGTLELPDEGPVTIEVKSGDGLPVCIGMLRVELLNEPITVPGS